MTTQADTRDTITAGKMLAVAITTRRALLGTAAVAVTATAAARRAADPDAALHAIAIEYLALNAEYISLRTIMRSDDDVAGEAAYDHCNTVLWPREDEIVDRAISARAISAGGARAKAAILQTLMLRKVPHFVTNTFEDSAEDHERLAMSLARDVLALEALA